MCNRAKEKKQPIDWFMPSVSTLIRTGSILHKHTQTARASKLKWQRERERRRESRRNSGLLYFICITLQLERKSYVRLVCVNLFSFVSLIPFDATAMPHHDMVCEVGKIVFFFSFHSVSVCLCVNVNRNLIKICC